MKKILHQKMEVNYLYFSCFLIFLATLSLSHYLNWVYPLKGIDLFFIAYATGQALLETFVFVFFAYLLKCWAHRFVYLTYIAISSTLLLLHFVNFAMVRLLDSTISHLYRFFFGLGIEHMCVSFQALNMNWKMILLIFITILFIPLFGLIFYFLTYFLIKKRPLNLSFIQIGISTLAVCGLLLILDLLVQPHIHKNEHLKYEKTLPLGTTFLSPQHQIIQLESPMKEIRDEKKTRSHLFTTNIQTKPNIFIFVIESLRKDYLTHAPNLIKFKNKNINFEHSYANAHSTQLSWFAIFHADYPLYWAKMRDQWEHGSIPLQLLKKLGYQIQVFSSADLRFFQMDQLIFGKNRKLIDHIEEFSTHSIEPYERDQKAIDSLKKNLKKDGNCYIVFLDATHSEYSFPIGSEIYHPYLKKIDYLSLSPKSPQLELLKNRYRNAIHFVDSLIGDCFTELKKQNLYEDAIIAITGDHGEEFFEDGALFHGSHLNEYQTATPLLLKIPSKDWVPQTNTATHISLLPSILHYLTKQSDFSYLFDGISVFNPNQTKNRFAFFQNGFESPKEFLTENQETKVHASFKNSQEIELIELQGFLKPGIFLELLK